MNFVYEKKRDIAVDCVKGLAIIGVVVSHTGIYVPFKLSALLWYLWMLPVFFCIAGFFIKEERLIHPFEFILKKTKTLYLKTILFVGAAVLCHNLFLKTGLYSETLDYGGKIMSLYSLKDVAVTLLKTIFFAGREPITGALWFAYVLFMALGGYSLLTYFLNKIFDDKQKLFAIKGLAILTLTIASNILTENFGITQNRLSNIFPAMLLIYIGQWFNVEKKLKYESPLLAFLCFLLVFQAAIRSGGIALNNNHFYDVFHLIVGGGAMTYFLLFVVKKINVSYMKNFFAFLGNYSFAIMALHFACLKICMIVCNFFFNTSFNIAALVPHTEKQYIAGFVFVLFSCITPAILAFAFDIISNKLFKNKIDT